MTTKSKSCVIAIEDDIQAEIDSAGSLTVYAFHTKGHVSDSISLSESGALKLLKFLQKAYSESSVLE